MKILYILINYKSCPTIKIITNCNTNSTCTVQTKIQSQFRGINIKKFPYIIKIATKTNHVLALASINSLSWPSNYRFIIHFIIQKLIDVKILNPREHFLGFNQFKPRGKYRSLISIAILYYPQTTHRKIYNLLPHLRKAFDVEAKILSRTLNHPSLTYLYFYVLLNTLC